MVQSFAHLSRDETCDMLQEFLDGAESVQKFSLPTAYKPPAARAKVSPNSVATRHCHIKNST
ncbi:MAG: hypothetical protein C0485_01520 [Pirellula sp.]|nr:hypothetical protein [Pirellula sp.]